MYKLRVYILLLIIPLLLTACTLQDIPLVGKFFAGTAVTGPVELSVWGLWDSSDIFATLVKSYQQSDKNVSVKYEDRSVIDLTEYKERVFERAVDPAGPDVMLVHNSWVPRMVAGGLLNPMPSGLIDAAAYKSTFYPAAFSSGVVNNSVYAVPFYHDGLVLVYNKTHFEEIGQSSPPTAWEEFRRLALQLSKTTEQGFRAGAAVGNADNIDHFSDIIGLMWAQAGVSIPDQIDSKAAQDAVTFYTNFVAADGVWSSELPEATTAFVNGQVSMILVPSWRLLDIVESMPDTASIGVAPVPQAIPANPASWSSFWMFVVPKSSKHADASWEFLNHLVSQKSQLMYFNEVSKSRSFGSPYSRVDLAKELNDNPYLGPILDMAPYAKTGEIAARSGNRRQVTALRDAVNSILGGTDVASALVKAKEDISK